MAQLRVAVPCANELGESAVWSVAEQALYWVDITGKKLQRLTPATGAVSQWPMPELCTNVALSRSGVVVSLQNALYRFDPAGGRIALLVEVEARQTGRRLNEMRVDRQGRLWVGSMVEGGGYESLLYRVTPDLKVTAMLGGIRTPNGLAWSPDGGMLYFTTGDAVVRAYPFDTASGTPGTPRVFFDKDAAQGRPDGACIDSEGYLWDARYAGGAVVRITPDGRLDCTVKVPAAQPTSVTFGGADLKTLYITTARQKLAAELLAAQPDNGHLFAIDMPVPGLPEPLFDIG